MFAVVYYIPYRRAEEMRKLESVWCGFLRRLVKGCFSRKNAPKNKKDKSISEDDVDRSFKLRNEAIREITKTKEIKNLCDMQNTLLMSRILKTVVFRSSFFTRRLRVHQGNGKRFQN